MIAAVKRRVREVLRRFGYEVVPSKHVESHTFIRHLTQLFDKLQIQCVLDVGANRGQYRQLLRERVGYEGLIISFEPLAQNIASLRAQAEADAHGYSRSRAGRRGYGDGHQCHEDRSAQLFLRARSGDGPDVPPGQRHRPQGARHRPPPGLRD